MSVLHIASASSPVPSEVFSLVALLVVSAVVLLILRFYLPLRSTPAYLLVPVFFALWLPAATVLLVPIDLASSAVTDDEASRGVWLPTRVLQAAWRVSYWLTFALTWFILPILAEFSDSGYREPKDRLMYSLRSNAQYYAIVFGSGLLGLVYVLVSYGVKPEALKSLVMALAYCWGLMLAIYLMGHGLVAIPRRLFRNASISGRLRRLQTHAPRLYEQMEDAVLQLEDLEIQLSELGKRSKIGSARDFQDWIEELMDLANLPESQPVVNGGAANLPRGSGVEAHILPTVITPKYMADLTRQLTRARHARSRYVGEWNRLLKEATDTQAILDSAASKRLDWGDATPHDTFWERFTVFTPYTRYLFYYHATPYMRLALGAVLSFASLCIIWSEVVKMALPQLSLISLSVVHHWTGDKGQVGFAGQVFAALWICYMCAAALTSVTEVRVWRGRALVRRNTAHESAFWYAGQVAKLTVPLSYNFLTFLGDAVYKKTVFYAFLGRLVVLTDLGAWFDYLFPAFVLVPVLATLFGLYGRIRRAFGFGVDLAALDEDEEDALQNPHGYGTGSWREGRDLIERELAGNGPSSRHSRYASAAGVGVLNGGSRAAPVLSVPRVSSPGTRSPLPGRIPGTGAPSSSRANLGGNSSLPQPRTVGGASSPRARAAQHNPEPDDDNFFSVLGHRIRNTVDTIDTPRWLRDIGDGIKKPKWMGGDDDDDGAGAGGVGGRGGNNSNNAGADFRRWFGGDDSGRIRL